jgi:hypothetical protein
LPTGVVVGDLLLAFIANLNQAQGTYGPPPGWTKLSENVSSNLRFQIWYKWSPGGEAATVTTTTPGNTRVNALIYAISGASSPYSQVTMAPLHPVTVTGSSVSPDPPAYTSIVGIRDFLWCAVAAWNDPSTGVTVYPTGFAPHGTAAGFLVMPAWRTLTTDTQNPSVFTIQQPSNWVTQTIAIVPGQFPAVTQLRPDGKIGQAYFRDLFFGRIPVFVPPPLVIRLPSALDPARVPRWCVKFARLGKTTYLSDVGGEVQGIYYYPGVVDVQHSDLTMDIEKMIIPQPSCTVTMSPNTLFENFIDMNELGQAFVTVSSWDGDTLRPVVAADMESPDLGYEGDLTTFRLSEKFRHDPIFPEKIDAVVNLDSAHGIKNGKDLLRYVLKHSTYPMSERDQFCMAYLETYLNQFKVDGIVDSEGPLFDLVTKRFQREYLFIMWEEGGLLKGWPIDPTAQPFRTLVFPIHLIQLVDNPREATRFTNFKIRYAWTEGSGWKVTDTGSTNDAYLKTSKELWGVHQFGDPVEKKRHAASVDCADISNKASANISLHRYVHLFHRGKTLRYLQTADDGADLPHGMSLSIVDPDRGLDSHKALLIGRQWVSPEFVINTFRTIHPPRMTQE